MDAIARARGLLAEVAAFIHAEFMARVELRKYAWTVAFEAVHGPWLPNGKFFSRKGMSAVEMTTEMYVIAGYECGMTTHSIMTPSPIGTLDAWRDALLDANKLLTKFADGLSGWSGGLALRSAHLGAADPAEWIDDMRTKIVGLMEEIRDDFGDRDTLPPPPAEEPPGT